MNKFSFGRTLFAACLAYMLIQIDVTAVNLALPDIAVALDAPLAGLQWVIDAYTLAFAGLMIPAGALADRWGARFAFAVATVAFLAGTVGCASAVSLRMLIVARVIQGAGAAMLVPAALSWIKSAIPEAGARAKALGTWSAAGIVATTVGPLAGGFLVGAFGWRSIFWINVPVALVALAVTVPVRRGHGEAPLASPVSSAAVIVVAAALVAMFITAPQAGWAHPRTLALAAVAVLGFIGFIYVERRSRAPLIPRLLRRRREFVPAVAAGFAINFAFYGFIFLLSLYWQTQRGYGAFNAGLAFLPVTLPGLAMSPLAGRWVARRGAVAPALTGLATAAAGYMALGLLPAEATFGWFVLPLMAMGAGTVTAVVALTSALLAAAGSTEAGVAGAAFNTSRQLGGSVGVALFGAVMAGGDFIVGLRVAALCAVAALVGAAVCLAYRLARNHPAPSPSGKGPD